MVLLLVVLSVGKRGLGIKGRQRIGKRGNGREDIVGRVEGGGRVREARGEGVRKERREFFECVTEFTSKFRDLVAQEFVF